MTQTWLKVSEQKQNRQQNTGGSKEKKRMEILQTQTLHERVIMENPLTHTIAL